MAVTFRKATIPDQPVAGAVVVTTRIYWDETRTRLLPEGHEDARFLAYAEGTPVPAPLAAQAGLLVFLAEQAGEAEAVEVEPQPGAEVPEKPRRRVRNREDRQIAPGVVADTSIDGEAHVLVSEPGSPLRNGVDK